MNGGTSRVDKLNQGDTDLIKEQLLIFIFCLGLDRLLVEGADHSKPSMGLQLCGPLPLALGWDFSGGDCCAASVVWVAPGRGHDPMADHWLAMGWCRSAWLVRGVGLAGGLGLQWI